jgi:predicted ATP-dependent endonuclease of OLD family
MIKPKTPEEWKAMLLKDWPSRLILTVLTAGMAYGYGQVDSTIKRKILDTVKPALDTLARKQETTDEKVEKVDAKLDAMIQVMIEAFPEFKKAAKERAQKNTDSKEVQDALTGGNP